MGKLPENPVWPINPNFNIYLVLFERKIKILNLLFITLLIKRNIFCSPHFNYNSPINNFSLYFKLIQIIDLLCIEKNLNKLYAQNQILTI
jgi:hypothetical protein